MLYGIAGTHGRALDPSGRRGNLVLESGRILDGVCQRLVAMVLIALLSWPVALAAQSRSEPILRLNQVESFQLPPTFGVRGGAISRAGQYAVFDESDIAIIRRGDGVTFMTPSSVQKPLGVRWASDGELQVVDGAGPGILIVGGSGDDQGQRFTTDLVGDEAVFASWGWVLSAHEDGREAYRALAIDTTPSLRTFPSDCHPDGPIAMAADGDTVLAISRHPPFDGRILFGPDTLDCQTVNTAKILGDVAGPTTVVASAAAFAGRLFLVVLVDTASAQRTIVLLDHTLSYVLRSREGPRVGILSTTPLGAALGYRQIPLPELILYRYELGAPSR